MYCPRCSQQQISEETKFCSSCGFPLGLVSEILAHGGFLPQLAELYKSKKWLSRRHGVVFSGLWTIFFLLILCPLFGIAINGDLAGISAIIGIFGGLMFLIASLTLLKSESKNLYYAPNELPDAKVNAFSDFNQRNLPPPQTQPAQSYVPPAGAWKAPNTEDFARPRSVVEGTTKLLEKDER